MLGLSRPHQQWIAAALIAISIAIVFRILRRRWARAMLTELAEQRPRAQPLAFVHRLRTLVFNDPFAAMNRLWGDSRDSYVYALWREAAAPASQAKPPANLTGKGLSVHRTHLSDGRAFAVIVMPPPERSGEAYLVGVALPSDERLMQDVARARRIVEMFVLNRGGGGDSARDTDLCGWRSDGKPLTYNVGAPRDVDGFARAVEAKLRELGR